jgi:hypothetical protein
MIEGHVSDASLDVPGLVLRQVRSKSGINQPSAIALSSRSGDTKAARSARLTDEPRTHDQFGATSGEQVMNSRAIQASIRASAAVLFGFGAITYASGASAACGDSVTLQRASYEGKQNGLLHRADFDRSIVGMWSFRMTAGGNPVDFGYQQWHSDGTELMNSGGRAPATENFCMGVWKQVAPARYHLNHFALSYDSSGTLNAKVNIKEDVTLGEGGTTYSGPFTLDVYDPNTNALLQHVAGQVTAQRVAAN